MKFSLIVPVYNTEKYLKRCLDSIVKQTYKNFEVIAINDGSKDNSKEILAAYKDKMPLKIIDQENHGLSYARNVGIKESTGDYLLFIDSDDYIESDLLKELNDFISDEDMLKFGYRELKDGGITDANALALEKQSGQTAFKVLVESNALFEMAWLYAYKKEYMDNFEFTENRYHEDFGLIPLMISSASKFSATTYRGYVYNRENETSITSYTDDKKEFKKAMDTLYFFQKVKEKTGDEYLLSFYSSGCLSKIDNLKGANKKEYIKELKKARVADYLLGNTFKRKIKKTVFKIVLALH